MRIGACTAGLNYRVIGASVDIEGGDLVGGIPSDVSVVHGRVANP